MRRIIVSIIGALSCYITLFAQNSDNVTGNSFHENRDQLQVPQILSISELSQLYSGILLPTTVLFTHEHNEVTNWKLKDKFQLKNVGLSTFNTRMINWGIADINNVGMRLLWQSTSKTSIEWDSFITKQYGYNLNSMHLSFGTKMNLNYHFNNKLKLSLWGQYLFKRNTDPFMRLDDNQPKNEVGLKLEYNPNINTKYSVGVSKQENYNHSQNQKSSIQVEGKAGFKF